jgi:hypothetical protein
MIRYFLIAIATVVNIAQPVLAAVLTAENKKQLCSFTYNGKSAVDKDVLAFLIAMDAGAGIYLDGSNPTGLKDGAIQLHSEKGIPSEPVYAVLNCLSTNESAKNRPFGSNVDIKADKRAPAACDAIQGIMLNEINFLTSEGKLDRGEVRYRVERRTMALNAPTSDKDWKDPKLLFQDDSPLIVLCEDNPNNSTPQVPAPDNSQNPSSGISVVDLIRLRGSVKDLTIKAQDIKSAKSASITYQRDAKADKETFGINGVVGLHFGDASGAFDVIPFISYENHSVTGGKGDVKTLSPGLLLGYKIERPSFAIHTKLEASLIEDLLYDSKQVKLRIYADPAFALGQGRGVLFGTYIMPIGPLQWRPDLTIIGDVSHVSDNGTNPALSEANNYYGLGGEFSLKTRLNLGQPISDFDLQTGVRYLKLLGDINKQEAHRWFGALTYSPANFPYIGISLSFSIGENDDTFKDEETYSLNFTVRY